MPTANSFQYDPRAAQPYVAPDPVAVKEPTVLPPPTYNPNNLGAAGAQYKSTGPLDAASSFVTGLLRGRAQKSINEAKKNEQMIQGAHASYSNDAQAYMELKAAGKADTDPEVIKAKNAVNVSYQNYLAQLEQHVAPQKGQKKSVGQKIKGAMQAPDLLETAPKVLDAMKQSGPPVFAQAALLSAQQKQAAQELAIQNRLLALNVENAELKHGQLASADEVRKKIDADPNYQPTPGEMLLLGIKPQAVPTALQPLGKEKVTQLNTALEDRWHVLNPGKALPAQYKLSDTATQEDYKTADHSLSEVESAEGTKEQRAEAAALRRTAQGESKGTWVPYDTQDASGNPVTRFYNSKNPQETMDAPTPNFSKAGTNAKNEATREKQNQSIDEATIFANGYLHQPHNGVGDQALMDRYFDVVKPSSGFRMTAAQRQGIEHARSFAEGLKAKVASGMTGALFSDDQRAQIVKSINDIAEAKREAQSRTPGEAPSSESHAFSLSAWKKANPHGDPNAAKAAAKAQGYEVVE